MVSSIQPIIDAIGEGWAVSSVDTVHSIVLNYSNSTCFWAEYVYSQHR